MPGYDQLSEHNARAAPIAGEREGPDQEPANAPISRLALDEPPSL